MNQEINKFLNLLESAIWLYRENLLTKESFQEVLRRIYLFLQEQTGSGINHNETKKNKNEAKEN
jgi:hypothetical protein